MQSAAHADFQSAVKACLMEVDNDIEIRSKGQGGHPALFSLIFLLAVSERDKDIEEIV